MTSQTATLQFRKPISIVGNTLVAGTGQAAFNEGLDSLLRTYLKLVREMRSIPRTESFHLRTADIVVLADHLGATQDQVLDRLGAIMGASSVQRKAMLSMLAAGAAVIVVGATLGMSGRFTAGTASATDMAAPAAAAVSVDASSVADTVRQAIAGPSFESVAAPAIISAAPAAPVVAPVVAPEAVVNTPTAPVVQRAAPAAAEVSAGTYSPAAQASSVAKTAPAANVGVGVDDAGNTVAVGGAPVPGVPTP